jgi:predicted S18 family serine protease
MAKIYRVGRGDLVLALLIVFLIGFIGGPMLFGQTSPQRTQFLQAQQPQKIDVSGSRSVEMSIPAVDSDGNGVIGQLITTVRPGTGQVLVNVNDVFAQFDTQQSARTAAKAAADYTKIDFNDLDVIYDIRVNATVIEGPSAGGAMAVSTALAAENMAASKSVVMTGTINSDGTIGPVGGILEKASAAKDNGATTFLVPQGQSTDSTPTRTRTCSTYNGYQVCQIKYVSADVNVGSSLNLTVNEVGTIGDAVKIFQQESNNPNVSI